MKYEDRIRDAQKLLKLAIELGGDGFKEQFILLSSALTMFFVVNDPEIDCLLDGFEKELKRLVKAARKIALEKMNEP